jgi:hypothetical protein
MPHFPHQGDGFEPAEALLDAPPLSPYGANGARKEQNPDGRCGGPGTARVHVGDCHSHGGEIPAASRIGRHACHSRLCCIATTRQGFPTAHRRFADARCRSALTEPGDDAGSPTEMREWQDLFWQAEAELAAVETHTERRIFPRSMRSQPASLVRGSSRRIMIVRFRPAYIRVIHRRDSALNCHLFCFRNKRADSSTISPRAGPNHRPPSGLDRSLHIRTFLRSGI